MLRLRIAVVLFGFWFKGLHNDLLRWWFGVAVLLVVWFGFIVPDLWLGCDIVGVVCGSLWLFAAFVVLFGCCLVVELVVACV